MSARTRVAILGAGWAGLAAATQLAARGIPVAVFEASRSLGGRARRVTLDGIDLDNGQHILIGAYRTTLALMRRVGVEPDRALLRQPLDLHYADGFRLRSARAPYPLNLLFALLLAKRIPFGDAMRAAVFFGRLRASGFHVAPDRPVEQWLEEQGQAGTLRKYLWEPLCVSALNTPAAAASAQVLANVLRDGLAGARENSDLLLPLTDLGRLFPEPAAAYVRARGGEIALGSPVRALEGTPGEFRVDDRPERYSHVIVACAPQHVGALLSPFPGTEAIVEKIERFEYQPIVTCYLQYARTVALPTPMLGFAGGLVQWVFDRGRLGGPPGLLAAVISASRAHAALDSDSMIAAVERELDAALGPLAPASWSRVITEKRATFSCGPSLPRPDGTTPIPGLLLAGDYLSTEYPGTLESAARSGVAAADRIIGAAAG